MFQINAKNYAIQKQIDEVRVNHPDRLPNAQSAKALSF